MRGVRVERVEGRGVTTHATQMLGMVVLPPNSTGLGGSKVVAMHDDDHGDEAGAPDVVHDDSLDAPVAVQHGEGAEHGVGEGGGVQEGKDDRRHLGC